ncbi:MAG: hypothetical protein QM809_04480 [Gordonia sp. (in: high G+C Gram-positive bacteria)]|uniref:hypothetical protein n=1 Tax=Gordonia sp. (in: high G+C Gram-positive bacteria) TaxID=84139 RepID=UPI0039E65869
MSDSGVDVLLAWAADLTERGGRPPIRERLLAIADAPRPWVPTSPSETPLAEVINHLIDQTELGVLPAAAVAMLPDHLRAAGLAAPSTLTAGTPDPVPADPVTAPPAATSPVPASAPGPEPVPQPEPTAPPVDTNALTLEALIAWRKQQTELGAPGAETIRDMTFKNLLKFGLTTPEQIRGALTGSAAELADDIAAVIARIAAVATGSGAPTATAAVVESPDPAVHEPAAVVPETPAAPVPPTRTASLSADTGISHAPAAPMLSFTHDDFCAFAFESDPDPNPLRVDQRTTAIRLAWEPMEAPPGQIVVYRLVSSDDSVPYKPEAGELLYAAAGTDFTDGRFLTTAVRSYQVWAHVGPDSASAREEQPTLWAQGEAISPVDDFEIFEEDGRVIGQWSSRQGTVAVRVTRRVLDGPGGGQQQVSTTDLNLTGFVDPDVPRGQRFLYRAESEVSVGGATRLSPPVQREILVSVSLTQVTDLAATARENSFDAWWTTPEAGQTVRIYRFDSQPPAGLDTEDREESVLTAAGFVEESRIKDPVQTPEPGKSKISGVRWPADWERVYLVPVTWYNGMARVGRHQVLIRPLSAVTAPRLIERVNTQLITFGWPEGAADVKVYVGVEGVPIDQILAHQPFAEVTAAQYRRDGAIILRRPLQNKGCVVYLVPVAFSRAEQLRGEPKALTYPGLFRARYELWPVPPGNLPPGTPPPVPERFRLAVQSDNDVLDPPPLVAVFNPDRLPLHPQDGHWLPFHDRGEQRPFAKLAQLPRSDRPLPTDFELDLRGRRGFFRVFTNSAQVGDGDGPRLALLDPPLRHLFHTPPMPPPGRMGPGGMPQGPAGGQMRHG